MKKKDPYRFAKICAAIMVFIFAAWLSRVFVFRGFGTLIAQCLERSNEAIVSAHIRFTSNPEKEITLNGDEVTIFLENLNELKARKPDIYEYKPYLEKQKQVKYTGKTADGVVSCEIAFYRDDGDEMATLRFQPDKVPSMEYVTRTPIGNNAYDIGGKLTDFVLKQEISADDIISALP